MKWIFLYLISSLISLITCDLYASLTELEEATITEELYIKDLREFIGHQKNVVEFLKRKLLNYKTENQKAKDDVEKYLSNPLNAFLIIKRMSSDVDKMLKAAKVKEFEKKLEDYVPNDYKIAHDTDLLGSILGLLRLQKMYNLSTTELSKGFINDHQYSHELSMDDCLQIAIGLIENEEYEYAIEWLKEANLKPGTDFGDFQANQIDVLEHLAVVYNRTGNYDELSKVVTTILELSPKNRLAINFQAAASNPSQNRDILRNLYQEACRGNLVISSEKMSRLKCYYVTNTTHFTKIAPIKAEEAFLDPYILVFHDVIFDSEIELLKILSRPTFERSSVVAKEGSVVSEVRVSKVAWLHDEYHKKLPIMTKRVEDMTGLSMEDSEPFQVQTYGIGGHYDYHTDFLSDMKMKSGDRIGTVLFYLSDVELGGATVFPYLKVKVQPKKGTAVYWKNLLKSGLGNLCTLHAACPVLVGQKWAANKWVHDFPQMHRQKCPLTEPKNVDCLTL